MRESSLIPTNLLTWPRVSPLLPEQKLILMSAWSAPWINCAGYGELPLRPHAAALGFDPSALETGIYSLVSADLLLFDQMTAELFVLDWFRFHKFKSEVARGILIQCIEKIQSGPIKSAVIDKSMGWLPTSTTTSTPTTTSTSTSKAKAKARAPLPLSEVAKTPLQLRVANLQKQRTAQTK